MACDYILDNNLTEFWDQSLGKAYVNFMTKPLKDRHLQLEIESRGDDVDGRKAREMKGWGPTEE